MVTPSEQEMLAVLRVLYGPDWFRQPRRTWEQIWRERRGELNHILGMRRFKGPRYQRGSMSVFPSAVSAAVAGTVPNLQDITHAHQEVAPQSSRIMLGWDSDGSIEHYFGNVISNIVYSQLTTQSDDSNDHSNDWWPDQPETNEGLNWDIRFDNEVEGGVDGIYHYLKDGGGVDRVSGTWYLLDTVSNNRADASNNGAIGINRLNGTAKSPSTGVATLDLDIEIRTTGTGSAVASQALDLEVEGT